LLLSLSLLAAKKKNPLLPPHLLLRQHPLLKPQLPPPLMLSLPTPLLLPLLLPLMLLSLPTLLLLLLLLLLQNNSMQSWDCVLKNNKATNWWLYCWIFPSGGARSYQIFTLNRPPAL